MRLNSYNPQKFYNGANGSAPSFQGKIPTVDAKTAGAIYTRLNCTLGGLVSNLTSAVNKKAPGMLENIGGTMVPKHESTARRLIEAVRDFFEMPFDIIDGIVSKIPNSKPDNIPFLKGYRAHSLKELEISALNGLYKNGAIAADYLNKTGVDITDFSASCSKGGKDVCDTFVKPFDTALNNAMRYDAASYDTKKERFITRIVSGFTAAAFLGTDFFNSAKLKGKTDEEAKISQKGKQKQEVIENLTEGTLQYIVNACLAGLVNSNPIVPVLTGTGISTVARIFSRKVKGRPIRRVKTPENSMAEFVRAAKNGETYKTQTEIDNETKKPVLTLKRIAVGCAGLIAAGYALRYAKGNKFVSNFLKPFRKMLTNFDNKMMTDVTASKEDISKLTGLLKKCGEGNLAGQIDKTLDGALSSGWTTANLGSEYKTVKLLGLFKVKVKDLAALPLVPFKVVKEIVSYPYKIASKFEAVIKNKMSGAPKVDFTTLFYDPPKDKTRDMYNIKNLFLRFRDFEKKFGSDPDRLEKEFGEYVRKMRLVSTDNKKSSKIDNSSLAVMSQIFGTLTGMGFSMNDDYNAAIKNGETRAEARKAARKRGLNKFARMTSQVAISGTLNNLFKYQYQGSLIGSAFIVFASTVITDMVSRVLTAFPTKKMNKEELEAYQKNHKEGKMAWYYNAIDKLAS